MTKADHKPRSQKPLIRVGLTDAQWNALRRCATGELESMNAADWDSGIGTDLEAAVKALDVGRRRRAKRLS